MFWPSLNKDERTERVHETVVEILDREAKGEAHKISWWAKWMFVRLHQRALRSAKEVPVEDIAQYLATALPTQIDYAAARQAARLVPHLPERHRSVMELMIDGANPLEISNELRMPIASVLAVIREARLWLSDGGCYLDASGFRPQFDVSEPAETNCGRDTK
jgi:DNA-directed RNA polymerase specialized sigma24 family protein